MGIFSKLFGSSDEKKAKCIIGQAERDVLKAHKPLGNLAIAIVKTSHECASQMKSMLNYPDNNDKQEAEVLVFYEFVYFFLHLTNRSAFSQLTEEQMEKLQNYLGPLISSTAVDTFFAHWPEDMKEKIRDEFYEKLNDSEIEYSSCKQLLSEEKSLTGNSLFSKLARNIADLSGNSMNPAVLTLVISSGVTAYKELQLDALVREAGNVL